MLVSFVDLNVVNGTDLYLAVVVRILDNFGLLIVAGVIAAVGFLALFLKKSAKYKTSTLAQ